MWKIFYNVLDVFANNSVRTLITSLGIGIASGASAYVLLSQYIDSAVSQASTMPMLGLLSMFGIDTALSLTFGAILTRGSIEASKLSFARKK
ncbi:DUF2523 family protein [Acinetobacter sp. WCHAc060025]|uniref:DUF2523 family protein n=1 Tax=Acinetobacter sp. WCHAc060025 TaxID=2518625 RepID=UPI001022AD72|nr:DUF2523 family protein [Acinetobacter sp. WCHAc060025]RZG71450.1 DUF2523 domain-containing protein [Acinetobacter sp. WCHAc060025]